ncbi:MAG TPA: hypothetical protein VJ853_07735 [Thermoanaerobaculia bacterium]|nr:hypothetical protein [Thermoanaerobaculia bacterium]
MARARERKVRELERGRIAFYLGERLLMDVGGRIILIGRKRITRRFWARVLVCEPASAGHPGRLKPARTPGEIVGEGDYRIFEHDGHTHLSFELDRAMSDINLPLRSSFIVTVMNPDPTVWQGEPHPFQEELFDLDRPIPTPFPPELQARFADRRYSQLDTTAFLDYPGAELVLISE